MDQRNLVFAANSEFLIPISLQPNINPRHNELYIFVRSNNLSLKYKGVTPKGCKDIGINKFEFAAMTQP